MRILLWHGYLLRGSGSNIYTANIAKVWRAQGHDVLLMCQERHPEALDFVDRHGDFNDANNAIELAGTAAVPVAGNCTVARPNIGRILPVYVFDEYEGFTAKRFVDLTDPELADYTERNVAAMTTAIEMFEPDAIITGHEVMGPYIALKACGATGTKYLAKLHGSALEYAVKEDERYLAYATEGLGGATCVTGGSDYMVSEAAAHIPGWHDRARVVNPGCDIGLFRPMQARTGLPTVGYVGKFIVMKGVHHLLAALPATSVDLRSVIVGYGGFDVQLRALAAAFHDGDLAKVASIAASESLDHVERFLGDLTDPETYLAKARSTPVEFTGRLEHGPLSQVLPTFDILVVPSILAEAFGMVAAEAAACAVLPVVPRHSGIGEVGLALEEQLGIDGLLTFDPEDPIVGIARCIDSILSLPEAQRRDLGARAATFARDRWSWERVAGDLLTLATAD